ncbi:Gfo/Idh/MocA family protein [Agilicoccus flavus]|uniref:Gfo/Idh/MocA family protein n=1 Tax=Agilicoccus flavus TaxID=2775968 RepID=UPI001CF6704A|nr:Gfo/Idh/MocA family oxidoreductase [Agilicoccus flavus]
MRAAIIGCGVIARNHVEAWRAAGVEVAVVADVDAAKATDFARRHDVPLAVADVADALAAGVDVVSVCTPHPTHPAIVLAAAAARVHVVCEKPLSIDVPAAERMVAACEEAGVVLAVCFQRRFWPAARRIRAALVDGSLGPATLGDCTVLLHRDADYYARDAWRGRWDTDGGGVLMTQGIHYVDMLLWFMGEPVEVSGRVATYVHGDHIEVEDSAVAHVTFADGGMATLRCSTAVTPSLGARVSVTGASGGTASVTEFPEGAPGVLDTWSVAGRARFEPSHRADVDPDIDLGAINAGHIPFHTAFVADVLDAIRTGRPPLVTGREALRSLRVVLAVYESARTGRPVRLDG